MRQGERAALLAAMCVHAAGESKWAQLSRDELSCALASCASPGFQDARPKAPRLEDEQAQALTLRGLVQLHTVLLRHGQEALLGGAHPLAAHIVPVLAVDLQRCARRELALDGGPPRLVRSAHGRHSPAITGGGRLVARLPPQPAAQVQSFLRVPSLAGLEQLAKPISGRHLRLTTSLSASGRVQGTGLPSAKVTGSRRHRPPRPPRALRNR